ncbi:hypothetical protein FRX31_027857 [Thalictrum thalictroides]|uniref:Uncharacterized protein n=1 Tax=Thalictrum thalictroides TaxID=46969 RepID=A0A7J6VBU1_THATH|nr:hypothetical protein FRX31_027857 [Thalictrum thalictroides]
MLITLEIFLDYDNENFIPSNQVYKTWHCLSQVVGLMVSFSHSKLSHHFCCPSIFFSVLLALFESSGSLLSFGHSDTFIDSKDGKGNELMLHMDRRLGNSNKYNSLRLEKVF